MNLAASAQITAYDKIYTSYNFIRGEIEIPSYTRPVLFSLMQKVSYVVVFTDLFFVCCNAGKVIEEVFDRYALLDSAWGLMVIPVLIAGVYIGIVVVSKINAHYQKVNGDPSSLLPDADNKVKVEWAKTPIELTYQWSHVAQITVNLALAYLAANPFYLINAACEGYRLYKLSRTYWIHHERDFSNTKFDIKTHYYFCVIPASEKTSFFCTQHALDHSEIARLIDDSSRNFLGKEITMNYYPHRGNYSIDPNYNELPTCPTCKEQPFAYNYYINVSPKPTSP